MIRRAHSLGLLCLVALGGCSQEGVPSPEINYVKGDLIQFSGGAGTPTAGWCWFQDERAIVDASNPDNPMLMFTGISIAKDNAAENGDLDLYWRNLASGETGSYELYDQFDADDHAVAALWPRGDGRTVAMFTRHGTQMDTYSRISDPHNPAQWQEAFIYTAVNVGDPEGVSSRRIKPSYSNLMTVGEGENRRLLNFTRSIDWNPNFLISADMGETWKYGGRLIKSEGRPYLQYTNSGDGSKVHFVSTDQHPRNFDNSIYHGVSDGKTLSNSTGDILDADISDQVAVDPTALTLVYQGDADNVAWSTDIEMDAADNPVITFSVQKGGAGLPQGEGGEDHRYHYARFDGVSWSQYEIAYAGTRLYSREDDYTGLMAIDPENVNRLVISTDADPDTGAPLISAADGKRHYEIYEGITQDGGKNWEWTALTSNSDEDNIRPIIPSWQSDKRVVLWMRGTYLTYKNYDTQLVGIVENR